MSRSAQFLLCCVAMLTAHLAPAAPPAAERDPQDPTSAAVRDARREYDLALSKARDEFNARTKQLHDDHAAKVNDALAAYLKKLDAAVDAALERKDLAEANRIDALRKTLRTPAGNDDATAAPAAREAVSLSDMEELAVRAHIYGKSGWGGGSKVRVNGVYSPKGIYLHPNGDRLGSVKYPLPGKFRSFKAKVGINDSANGSVTPVTFRVLGDGRLLWQSEPMQKGKVLQAVSVPIANVKVLELQVESEGDYTGAHCVWIEPAAVR